MFRFRFEVKSDVADDLAAIHDELVVALESAIDRDSAVVDQSVRSSEEGFLEITLRIDAQSWAQAADIGRHTVLEALASVNVIVSDFDANRPTASSQVPTSSIPRRLVEPAGSELLRA